MAGRKHVVVVGGGFGGLETAKALSGEELDVTLVDRRNYHLFQPLLYQVAMAGLSPADIASPIRGILGSAANVRVVLGEVTGIDLDARVVELGGDRLRYDVLVLAVGAKTTYFGHEAWEAHAPSLKTIEDAPQQGGHALGSLGPVTEGWFAWFFGLGILVADAVWLGQKSG